MQLSVLKKSNAVNTIMENGCAIPVTEAFLNWKKTFFQLNRSVKQMENYISIDKNMIVYFGTDAQEMTWHDVRKPLFPSASLGYNRSNQFRCRQTAPGIGRRTRTLFHRFSTHRNPCKIYRCWQKLASAPGFNIGMSFCKHLLKTICLINLNPIGRLLPPKASRLFCKEVSYVRRNEHFNIQRSSANAER